MSAAAGSLFERSGGEPVWRAVMATFFERVFDDVMIGYLFMGQDRARLEAREFELAARALGATSVHYAGRPLREAHRRHTILGGHFERRLVMLREAMQAHGVPQEAQDALLSHNRSLRHLITANEGSQCIHDEA